MVNLGTLREWIEGHADPDGGLWGKAVGKGLRRVSTLHLIDDFQPDVPALDEIVYKHAFRVQRSARGDHARPHASPMPNISLPPSLNSLPPRQSLFRPRCSSMSSAHCCEVAIGAHRSLVPTPQ